MLKTPPLKIPSVSSYGMNFCMSELYYNIKQFFAMSKAGMAEWLRRWTAKQMGFSQLRFESSEVHFEIFVFNIEIYFFVLAISPLDYETNCNQLDLSNINCMNLLILYQL